MPPAIHVIEVSATVLVPVLAGLVLLWFLSRWLLKSLSSVKDLPEGEKGRDWSIPPLDSQAHGDSPFHRWDPRIKIVALLFFMFCAASLTRPFWAFIAIVWGALSVATARIPFRYPLKRLTAMAGFLGMFLVVMPLTVSTKSGDTLLVLGGLTSVPLNLRGFALALLICLKASAIALLVEPLLATSPFPVTMQALAGLRVPRTVCQMLMLAYRYIFVFQEEVVRMNKGMNARGFTKRTDMETLRTIGNFLGMLLVRSFERTQRVYEAMLARGYTGVMVGDFEFHAQRQDWAKGAFWFAAGLALIVADRFTVLPDLTAFF